MTLSISLIFVAVLTLIQIPMTIAVGFYRAQTGIRFLDGGDTVLMQRMRAHGNFTETVPIALLAMATAEYLGASPLLLWTGGGLLLAGRMIHYWVVFRSGWGNGRAAGMLLTFTAMILFSAYALVELAGVLA